MTGAEIGKIGDGGITSAEFGEGITIHRGVIGGLSDNKDNT